MNYWVEASCGCRIGKIRTNNEDNLLFFGKILPEDNSGFRKSICGSQELDGMICFAVFDGMGGEDYGEIASFTAAQTMRDEVGRLSQYIIPERKFLIESCDKMNQEVFAAAQAHGTQRMGTTAAMLLFTPQEVYACNAGDSKIFRLRKGAFMQLSQDHTDVQFMKECGITNRRPHLTQYLGIDPKEIQIQPYIAKGDLQPGDRYLICSDGLTDMVSNFDICNTMLIYPTAEACTERLMRNAMSAGGRDNTTVIIIDIN